MMMMMMMMIITIITIIITTTPYTVDDAMIITTVDNIHSPSNHPGWPHLSLLAAVGGSTVAGLVPTVWAWRMWGFPARHGGYPNSWMVDKGTYHSGGW